MFMLGVLSSMTYSTDYDAAYGVIGAGITAVYLLVMLAVAVFGVVCTWKLFTKAGEPGWKCIIPYYNLYVFFKIVYGDRWYRLFFLFIPFANIYFFIKFYLDLAKAFGKGAGYGIGLIFLNVIFLPMLAFGDAKYVGFVKK